MSEISEKTIVAHEQTLNAMANVNAVDGFDPCLVTACYRDEEGKSRMYLQAEPAMLWFRLKHPNGRLEQVLTRANDQMATVEGRVIDSNGNLLANAFATRYRSDDNKFGKDYIQNAGTAAIRKALGNCGFGTPANAEYIEGITPLFTAVDDEDAPVDSGVPTRIPVPPIPKEYQNQTPVMVEDTPDTPAATPKTTKRATRKNAKAEAPAPTPAPVPEKPAIQNPEPTPAVKKEAPAKPATAPAQPPIPVPPTPTTAEVEPKTLEEALAFKISVGRFSGKTMKEVVDSGSGAAITYFLRPQYAGKPFRRLLAWLQDSTTCNPQKILMKGGIPHAVELFYGNSS